MRPVWGFLAILAAGCASKPAPVPTAASPSTSLPANGSGSNSSAADPEAGLHEKMRQGAFNLDACQGSLEVALEGARKLAPIAGGEAKDALEEVATKCDSAGRKISDFTDAPPSLEEFRREFSEQDERRLKAIDAALAALTPIRDARDILEDLAANAPPELKPQLDATFTATDEANDACESAIVAFGGKVPPDADPTPIAAPARP